jgi:hypothetical protein
VLVAAAAFGLYWLSSLVLEARDATLAFGADTWVYAELARGNVLERIGDQGAPRRRLSGARSRCRHAGAAGLGYAPRPVDRLASAPETAAAEPPCAAALNGG